MSESVIDRAIAAEGLGERLRAAREARRMTLEAVAVSADLTKGYLSKIERSHATPSVAVLIRLCSALDLSVGELFDPHFTQDLVRVSDRQPIFFGGEGLQECLLTPAHESRVQVIHSVVEPGGGSGSELYRLPCDVGVVFVLSGRLSLSVSERVHILEAGDTLTYRPSEPHAFANPETIIPAEVVWILNPALPQGWKTIPGFVERRV